MPTEVMNILMKLGLGPSAGEKMRLEGELLLRILIWLETQGPSALNREQDILRMLQDPKLRISSIVINAVRQAFANLRTVMTMVQQASKMPPTAIWQSLFQSIRGLLASAAGGLGNIGQAILSRGQSLINGVGPAIAAAGVAARVAAAEISAAISEVVLLIGGWEVILGAVVVALLALAVVALVNYIANKNQHWVIEDPVLKQFKSCTAPPPVFRLRSGNVG